MHRSIQRKTSKVISDRTSNVEDFVDELSGKAASHLTSMSPRTAMTTALSTPVTKPAAINHPYEKEDIPQRGNALETTLAPDDQDDLAVSNDVLAFFDDYDMPDVDPPYEIVKHDQTMQDPRHEPELASAANSNPVDYESEIIIPSAEVDPVLEQGPFWSSSGDFRWTNRTDIARGDAPFWTCAEEFVVCFQRISSVHKNVEELLPHIVGHYAEQKHLGSDWQHDTTIALGQAIRKSAITARYNYDEADPSFPLLTYKPPIEELVSQLDFEIGKFLATLKPLDFPLPAVHIVPLKKRSVARLFDYYQRCLHLAFMKMRWAMLTDGPVCLDAFSEYELASCRQSRDGAHILFSMGLWPVQYHNPLLRVVAGWIYDRVRPYAGNECPRARHYSMCFELLGKLEVVRKGRYETLATSGLSSSSQYLFDLFRNIISKLAGDLHDALQTTPVKVSPMALTIERPERPKRAPNPDPNTSYTKA